MNIEFWIFGLFRSYSITAAASSRHQWLLEFCSGSYVAFSTEGLRHGYSGSSGQWTMVERNASRVFAAASSCHQWSLDLSSHSYVAFATDGLRHDCSGSSGQWTMVERDAGRGAENREAILFPSPLIKPDLDSDLDLLTKLFSIKQMICSDNFRPD
ncbi:hypothetical protein ACH5RR_029082 [Cinchona calisaya]|uniref:Uncharacterized protein n=1 Tax=Cinchona calisaya TaxID=153742 RepID=A0ABD2YSU9_9GENT